MHRTRVCVCIRVYNILYAYNLTEVRGCPIKPSSTITRRALLITRTHRHTYIHARTHTQTLTNRTVTMTTGPRHLHISPKIARGLFYIFRFFFFLYQFSHSIIFPYFFFHVLEPAFDRNNGRTRWLIRGGQVDSPYLNQDFYAPLILKCYLSLFLYHYF